jgi:hypothetical protein
VIFIDAGAFIARYSVADEHHRAAVSAWKQLAVSTEPLLTSNLVIAESFTLLARRGSYRLAAEQARLVLASRGLRILRPDAEADAAALDEFERFADQRVSFADCVSFVLMRRHRVKKAFTFDRHFTLAGFARWP